MNRFLDSLQKLRRQSLFSEYIIKALCVNSTGLLHMVKQLCKGVIFTFK